MTDKKIIDAYKKLDDKLHEVIVDFWAKNPGIPVSTSGSVLYGEWHAMRSTDFDGLKFKLTLDEISTFVRDDKITLTHSQMITQEELR